MAQLQTVKIKNPKGEGFVLINEGDFDPQMHKRWEEVEPKGEGQKKGEQKAPTAGEGQGQKKGG